MMSKSMFLVVLLSILSCSFAFSKSHKYEWENHQLNKVNEEPWRSGFFPLSDSAQVFHKQRETDWYKLLNGKWRFRWSADFDERPVDFYKSDYSVSNWDFIDVPCSWQMRGYGQPYYRNIGFLIEKEAPRVIPKDIKGRPVGSYVTHFEVPKIWEGKNVYINFEGVESAYWFWVNGKKVGYSEDSRTTSEFNITPYLKEGTNVLAVEVYRLSDGSFLEDQDGWRLSGIFRDVYLIAKPDQHIRDFFVKPELNQNLQGGSLSIDIELLNLDRKTKGNVIEVSLYGTDRVLLRKEQTDPFEFVNGVNEISFLSKFKQTKLWSNEVPNLYYVVMELKTKDGLVLDRAGSHFGFRKIEVKGRQLFVNGKPFLVKGVNRVEHDPANGKHIREEMLMKDLMLIKQNNMNTIRTSHYPHDLRFYEWCDRIGIWVIDEANVESHGYGNNAGNALAKDPSWKKAHLERMEAMIQRDKNFPSILMWSLGNEAGYGENLIAMHHLSQQLDPSRPTHYHAAERPTCCDVLGGFGRKNAQAGEFGGANRYHSIPILEKIASMDDDRPFMLNEFAHAMGNSIGSLPEYISTFEKHPELAGACVWDWVDQGLNAVNEQGESYWAYGGDFGDHSGDKNFCLNGVVFPDRSGKGKLTEVKHAFQNISFALLDKKSLLVELTNKFQVNALKDFSLSWKLLENGTLVETGTLNDIETMPESKRKLKIPSQYAFSAKHEYVLLLDVVTCKNELWADAGFSLAAKSFKLTNWKVEVVDAISVPGLEVEETDKEVMISNENMIVKVDKTTGLLKSYAYKGQNLLVEGPVPHFWRAPTDNDKGIKKQWMKAHLHTMSHRLKDFKLGLVDGGDIEITSFLDSKGGKDAPGMNVKLIYLISANGTIHVQMEVEPYGAMPSQLPRIGMQLKVNKDYSSFSWYGNGPFESYSDRKAGVMPGIWSGAVEEQWVNYPKPQENGNKTDVRWCLLKDGNENGLKVISDQLFQTSVSYYDTKNLSEANHPYDLVRKPYVVLNIDKEMAGLGNASCGAVPPLENYWVKPVTSKLHFVIMPLK